MLSLHVVRDDSLLLCPSISLWIEPCLLMTHSVLSHQEFNWDNCIIVYTLLRACFMSNCWQFCCHFVMHSDFSSIQSFHVLSFHQNKCNNIIQARWRQRKMIYIWLGVKTESNLHSSSFWQSHDTEILTLTAAGESKSETSINSSWNSSNQIVKFYEIVLWRHYHVQFR